MSAYHAESVVSTLAAAVAADPSVVAKVYSQQLRKGARSVDDFSMFEGGEGSGKPFIVRKDIASAHAGDEVKFTVMSQPRGPGARGEQPLRGNESSVDFKTFGCVVDFWRDAFKFTKKSSFFRPWTWRITGPGWRTPFVRFSIRMVGLCGKRARGVSFRTSFTMMPLVL
jgi:hypothetical protein